MKLYIRSLPSRNHVLCSWDTYSVPTYIESTVRRSFSAATLHDSFYDCLAKYFHKHRYMKVSSQYFYLC